jgi:hypothetical protein
MCHNDKKVSDLTVGELRQVIRGEMGVMGLEPAREMTSLVTEQTSTIIQIRVSNHEEFVEKCRAAQQALEELQAFQLQIISSS